MRVVLASVIGLSVVLAAYVSVQGQTELEKKIEKIFLYQPTIQEKYDKKAKLKELGQEEEVKAILLNMLSKYKYADPETMERLYLNGAVWMLGEMEVKPAIYPLSQTLFDRKVHENVRALAAKSLGQIDVEANKQHLLKALANVSDYYLIRIYAAEALGRTKDPEVLKALERYSREEKDSYVREIFQKAAQEVRAKMSGSR